MITADDAVRLAELQREVEVQETSADAARRRRDAYVRSLGAATWREIHNVTGLSRSRIDQIKKGSTK